MEKRGEFLTQIAIISDLLENVNLTATSKTVILEVDKTEFDRIKTLMKNKKAIAGDIADINKFTIEIGEITFVVSTNNV
jgi:CRP-like cAMP-binding protein